MLTSCDYFEYHMRTTASENVFMKLRTFIHNEFWFYIKNQVFSTSISETSSWLVFHDWFPMKPILTHNISLNKRRSKVQEKNMSCERALNFNQWKTFSENYKPMRVWLWLVYKFTENYYPSRLFSEFIQTQKRYPTSLDKIRILTWKLLVISS